MGYFNLAWFAWGSPETNLGDTVEYNTLVRVTSPYDRLATAIVKLFVHYNVRSNDLVFGDLVGNRTNSVNRIIAGVAK